MKRGSDDVPDITFTRSPAVHDAELNALFIAAWPEHESRSFAPILERSLGYVCTYVGGELIDFVNLAWDGGSHAFLLDTTVHPRWQRRGIGRQLVEKALELANARGVEWVHVDYEPHLEGFYSNCGFQPSLAGLRHLGPPA